MIFHPLHTTIVPPTQMNNPFSYTPHALCIEAATQLQATLPEIMARYPGEKGKMFGVLVVKQGNSIGYLQAYSGQLEGHYPLTHEFVPPVFDYLQPTGHFKQTERQITTINHRLEAMQRTSNKQRTLHIDTIKACGDSSINAWKKKMAEDKQRRNQQRATADSKLSLRLTRESQYQKAQLHRIKERWKVINQAVTRRIEKQEDEYRQLALQRRTMSDDLQRWLFAQFVMRNARGEEANLIDIFAHYDATRPYLTPPGGTGECCEPKLLQYAYLHGMQPLCMAMFWWGESMEGEIRHHLHYYPACQSKCRPVLSFMLQGLNIETENKQTTNSAIEIIYEDEWLVVVCKPSGMLSVPGRTGEESVATLMRQRYANATGPMMVHRLDMDTSGLMIVALTSEVYHKLQRQFAAREIRKTYVALLEPSAKLQLESSVKTKGNEGEINLPLAPAPNDRPRQRVDYSEGKEAHTRYRFIDENRVELHPITGRTHQLRVHCAHASGLGRPIQGDLLYGHGDGRLCLHARTITFIHPITGKQMTFSAPEPF